jgi:RNA polymerase sigma-70 factor (ECF subfamily)
MPAIPSIQEEFLKLLNTESQALSNYCRALCNHFDDAEDLMSETVLIAFRNFEKINDKSKFKFYLFGVASKLFKKWLRRKKLASFLPLSNAKQTVEEQQSDEKAALALLYQLVEKLKPIQAEIIVLKEISGFKIKEIALLLNLNENTVKTHLTRAKQSLQQMLEKEYEPNGKLRTKLIHLNHILL